jgi:hypothetical protein
MTVGKRSACVVSVDLEKTTRINGLLSLKVRVTWAN